MTDTPRTFEDRVIRQAIRDTVACHSNPLTQGECQALIDAIDLRDSEMAEKDRRIASLEADATDTGLEKNALQGQIDEVMALAEWANSDKPHWDGEYLMGMRSIANMLLAALGEPAAEPEREP